MEIELSSEVIISKFRRNQHNISSQSLKLIRDYLKRVPNASKSLNTLIAKVNEMDIMSKDTLDRLVKLAIEMLEHGQSFNSYQQVVSFAFRWSCLYLSPYQTSPQTFFCERPEPNLFMFSPADKTAMHLARFRRLSDFNCALKGDNFLGILYENHGEISSITRKPQLLLESDVAQRQIVLSPQTVCDCLLVPGCAYLAQGKPISRLLGIMASQITLPKSVPAPKQLPTLTKFKKMCQKINQSKGSVIFEKQDFVKYETVFNMIQQSKPILVFGNVTLSNAMLKRIYGIVSMIPQTECLILMLSEKGHEDVDIKVWLSNQTVFLVPHINADGPRILPKIPILKQETKAKVLTNPARMAMHGIDVLFANISLLQAVYSRALIQKGQQNGSLQQMAAMASDLVFSQGSLGFCFETFWRQSEYLTVWAETVLIVSDRTCPQMKKRTPGGGYFVNTGDFERDGDFLCFVPESGEEGIQLSSDPNSE